MSRVRTQPTESATKRDVFAAAREGVQNREGRETRAEFLPSRPKLEYGFTSGGPLKWPSLFYGGETRAGQ